MGQETIDEVVRLLSDPQVIERLNVIVDRDSEVERLVQKNSDNKELGRLVRRLYTKKETKKQGEK